MDCPTCGTKGQDAGDSRFCTSCGTSLAPPEEDRFIGQVVGGRFRVTDLIAEGGMGRVYGAEQRMGMTLRRVAIKTLLSDIAKSEPQMQRFMAECSVVAQLEHPNTIKFYDWGTTDAGDLYIAMEFVAGESLADVVRRETRLNAERVDIIVGQICGSLQEAHDKGIVHRDVKPENLLLTSLGGEEDFVKVVDFGIAKREGQDVPKLTPLGLVLGSPAYMSPEQFTHGPLDGRSDVYSLGVVTYEALTGFQPFTARDLLEWPMLHRKVEPRSFESTGVDVPLKMRRAVERAMAKHPDDRYASMRDFFVEFTLGTPRRNSLISSRPHVAADEAVTRMRASSAAPAAVVGSGAPKAESLMPATVSEPPVGFEASTPPPPLVVPKAPRMPSAMVPPTEPMLKIPDYAPPEALRGAEPAMASSSSGAKRRGDTAPMSVQTPVPATVREPRRRWGRVVLGLLFAIAVGGVVAALVVPRSRWSFDGGPSRPAPSKRR